MPFNGSGTYSLPAGYAATANATATASQHNTPLEDIRDALNGVPRNAYATTVSAAWTISGNWTISGDPAFTGNPDFSGAGNISTIRSDLGLAIGADVQAYSAILATLASDSTLPTYTVTDFDTALESGFIYAGAGASNAPSDLSASAINGFVSRQGDNDLLQLVVGQSITRMYWRLRNAGTWSSWERAMRFSDVLDEDDFASDDPDMPPSQQSVGAYVGLAKISETTISSDATIDLTLDTATYRSFVIELSNVVPATDTVDLFLRTSDDGGSTFEAGASDYANVATGASPTTDEAIYLTLTSDIGSAAGEDGLSGIITIHDPGDATTKTKATYNVTFINSGGNLTSRTGGGVRATAEANDAIRFLMSSGNLESGKVTLYGMK